MDLSHIALWQWTALAVIGIVIVAMYVPWGSLRLPSLGAAVSSDPDVADLAALKLLNARYADCPEGKAALKTLATHFFEHGGGA